MLDYSCINNAASCGCTSLHGPCCRRLWSALVATIVIAAVLVIIPVSVAAGCCCCFVVDAVDVVAARVMLADVANAVLVVVHQLIVVGATTPC